MSESCVLIPKRGAETFLKLKNQFGRDKAAIVFNNVQSKEFTKFYKDSFTYDSEGIPTYESIINNKSVQNYLGIDNIIQALNKKRKSYPNTIENVTALIQQTILFNKESKDFVQYVTYDKDQNLVIETAPKIKEFEDIAKYQSKIQSLNEFISNTLEKAGVSLGFLNSVETAIGRVGLTNFNHAKNIANNFAGLIGIANNMEGFKAESEEFSHLLVRLYSNDPLIARSLQFLTNYNNAIKLFNNNEVEYLLDYYNGNMKLVAEELLGRMLQQKLINNIDSQKKIDNTPLIKRAFNKIISFFKGYNPFKFRDTIDSIDNYIDDFSKKVINNQVTITPKKIVKIQDNTHFNALSERANQQKTALNKVVASLLKRATLQKDYKDISEEDINVKQQDYELVNRIKSILHKNLRKGESMAAISETLNQLLSDIKNNIQNLNSLETLSLKDQALLLYNTIISIQSNDGILKEIRKVLTEEFLSDEDINSQNYVYSDTVPLANESETEEASIDTSGMSNEEIMELIEKESQKFKKSDDEKTYQKEGLHYERTTSIISFDSSALNNLFDPNNPWYTPSTNIGTTMDEIVRDFFSGRLQKKGEDYVIQDTLAYTIYPNITKQALNNFLQQLEKFKKDLDAKGITIMPRDVTVSGTVGVIDMQGNTHNIRVAGTLDLLGVDKQGNWHIYDMKTFRSDKIGGEKLRGYERQLTLYKQLLEKKYGIKVASLNIIPIKVTYPSPTKEENPANYTVSEADKHELYNGEKNNQLFIDGQPFKGTNPKLEQPRRVQVRALNISYTKYTGDTQGGLSEGKAIILNLLRELTQDQQTLQDVFMKKAKQHTINFAESYVGQKVEDTDSKGNLVKTPVSEVLFRSFGDITLMSKLFLTQSRMGNVTLQIFNSIIRQQKAKKRFKVIELSQRIQALGAKYEKLGITSYEWMYSEDRRSYIIHTILEDGTVVDYDNDAYLRAQERDFKNIEQSEKDFVKVAKLKQQWVEENTTVIDYNGKQKRIPLHAKYPSRYNNLSSIQKEFYDQWLSIKQELDALLPENKTSLFNTIKIRKRGMERVKNTLKGKGVTEFINSIKDTYLKGYDEQATEATVVQKDFLGEEKLNLPLYYIGNRKDIDYSDLSLDAIGTLIAYADMACNYETLDEIINSLEVSKYVLFKEHKLIVPNKKEQYRVKNGVVESEVLLNNAKSQFMDALSNMLKLKVYDKIDSSYDEEEGQVSASKAANFLLKIGSYTQLGFNLMANTANLLTGIATINIEMAAGQYFNRKELAKADRLFMKEIGSYVGDIGQRIPKSKLALYLELLNVKQDFQRKKRNVDFLSKTILGQIFGPHLQFLGQEAGDIWLYSRTALAMGEHENIYDSKNGGKKISVWDALEKVPVNKDDESLGYKLVIKDGIVKENGESFTLEDISKHSTKVTNVNQRLFGNYNDEDLIQARTYILGRFVMQYRDFLPTALMMRFQSRRADVEGGNQYEGMYVSVAKLFRGMYDDLKNGEINVKNSWHKLQPDQQQNIRRALMELGQFMGVVALGTLLKKTGTDKKKKSWFRKYIEYMLTREKTELGAMIPGPNISELFTIVNSPIANTSTVQSIWNLTNLLWIPDYFTEIESGKYKGHSEAYRTFIKSPLSLWYKNIDRLLSPEDAEKFYNRN